MQYKCSNCEEINDVPKGEQGSNYTCYKCNQQLPETPISDGTTSAAVGMIGGAALGASVAGPVGAIIGGIIGAVVGKESKGVG